MALRGRRIRRGSPAMPWLGRQSSEGRASERTMHKAVLTFATALLFGLAPLTAAAQSARDGRVMWSAFECATFAELSGDKKENERLFGIGLKAGRQFVEAVKNGQISPEAVRSEVPIGVTLYLAGPTVDFIIGRIFENATKDAFDAVVERKNGQATITDDEVRKSNAQHRYGEKNCTLIR